MSYTEIYAFDLEGNAHEAGEVHNAFRGGMAVWKIMEKRHLPPFIPNYVKACNWYYPGITAEEVKRRLGYEPNRATCYEGKGEEPAQAIWDLCDNPEVPLHERIVMYTTFDYCLVKKENIGRVVDAFRAFDGDTSLKEQADILEKLAESPEIVAVGWNGTSVNVAFWITGGGCDEDGESIPYNCLTGDKHFWLFDELNEGGESGNDG